MALTIIRLWFLTAVCFGVGGFVWFLYTDVNDAFLFLLFGTLAALMASIPALIILLLVIKPIDNIIRSVKNKYITLIIVELLITLGYGTVAGIVDTSFNNDNNAWMNFFSTAGMATGALFASCMCAMALSHNKLTTCFSNNLPLQTQINTNMEHNYSTEQTNYPVQKTNSGNKTLNKAIITGVLILAMLIPTFFISGLVTEREERQEKIVAESSSRWSNAQTLSGPYIFIPYKNISKHIILLPENADINGEVIPEERDRSIYKVLFYKSNIKSKGSFEFKFPKDIDSSNLDFSEAKICLGISDYKGIEEKVSITFNGILYELSPGLPTAEIDSVGLSAAIQLSLPDIGVSMPFNYDLKIKGAGQLHFLPLSGNSSFTLKSSWNKPSFDGNTLPNDNKIDDNGFTAKWIFNKANLPFPSILTDGTIIKKGTDFGVSIVQPADHYAKTGRCVKYAILFIGLTFSLFFIIEIMQKKSMHPVQYILVGLALVIFYTLLLSISEYVYFDYAYLIAAIATVSLISLYAKSHFNRWKIAGLFTLVLSGLYGFNYVLVSLEDTALLVGSVSLFIVLSIVMYVSRKINWYGATQATVQTQPV